MQVQQGGQAVGGEQASAAAQSVQEQHLSPPKRDRSVLWGYGTYRLLVALLCFAVLYLGGPLPLMLMLRDADADADAATAAIAASRLSLLPQSALL